MTSTSLGTQFICNGCIRSLQSRFRPSVPTRPILQTRGLRTRLRTRPTSRALLDSERTPPALITTEAHGSPRAAPKLNQGHVTRVAPASESRSKPRASVPSSDPFSTSSSTPFPECQTPLHSKPARKSKDKTPPAVQLTDSMHWYWETIAPTCAQKNAADTWFTKSAKPQFLRSVALFRLFPESDVPEVAFVGRSNVGKSSLLNALVGADVRSGLARTSKTPGCTKTLNLYGVGPMDGVRIRKGKNNGHDRIVGIGGLLIVDLPGYGEGSLSEWGPEIMKYLVNRKQLRRVFVLIDAGVGIKDKDRSLLASLRMAGVPHQVILSKVDKVYLPQTTKEMTRNDLKARHAVQPFGSAKQLAQTMQAMRDDVKPPNAAGALGELLTVSSEILVDGKRLGVDAVRVAVLQAAGVKYEAKKGKKRKA